eukprot:1196431-Prorocentrum_minimum.AAC.6
MVLSIVDTPIRHGAGRTFMENSILPPQICGYHMSVLGPSRRPAGARTVFNTWGTGHRVRKGEGSLGRSIPRLKHRVYVHVRTYVGGVLTYSQGALGSRPSVVGSEAATKGTGYYQGHAQELA